ncbi:hypothetical protein N8I77_002792 [Diaporthe amygdali]|uniref:Peptidase M3A/M3B catalytic domain-containing protein n=1 Tax=Phomopsis amygdali TaxID=1214568 RepID=A0AAD9WAP5_PHOAM|nr:hypothetical protein N8I77_002792 [Diaporthe amygdali]
MSTTQPPPAFSKSPRSILNSAQRLVENVRRLQDELVRTITPSAATFSNVMLPLVHMENEFRSQANLLGFYSQVSEDEELREASTKAQMLFADFQAEAYLRQDIYRLVNAVRELHENLDPESALLVERIHDQHIQSGAAILDPEQRQRFRAIQGRLSQIRAGFLENINSDNEFICFTSEELDGVPTSIQSRLEKTEQEETFRVYLADPGDTAIMSYAKADTRRRLFTACQNRCSGNIPLLKEAVVLRHEAANLLGFPSHAALRLQGRMVKTAETVGAFLVDLREKLAPGGLDSLKALNDLKKSDTSHEGDEAQLEEEIKTWDLDFYRRLMMQQQVSLDGKRIMEYFPVQTTISRMLRQFSRLFGLRFAEITGVDKNVDIIWHEDVKIFSVYDDDAGGGNFLGYLYLDLYYRPGKSPQAACFSFQPGFVKEDGTRNHPVTALLCAFSRPTPKKPSLLRHFDVVTIFHELGHGIHDLVSKTKYARFHGPGGVAVDFGEMPSQMLEQWCWQPSQLKYLSFHYSNLDEDMLRSWQKENDGVSRPEVEMPHMMIAAIIRSRRLTFGPLFHLEQLHRAAFDLAINQVSSFEEAEAIDLTATWNRLGEEFGQTAHSDTNNDNKVSGHGYATHTHLVQDDYEAGYYAYLFSQVYAADLFYSHFEGYIMDSNLGRKLRHTILEKGGNQDEMESIVRFLGREPSSDAFNEHVLGVRRRG